jgi:hypothetical protein
MAAQGPAQVEAGGHPLGCFHLGDSRIRNHAPLARRCRGIRKLGPCAADVCGWMLAGVFQGVMGLAAGWTEGALLCCAPSVVTD